MSIDLHTHSTYSDGTKSPEELVAMAASRGLKALSITDHDTVAGVSEAIDAGWEFGVEVIAGLEVSVDHNGQYMHILGYGFEPEDQTLLDGLAAVQEKREQRNFQILDRLAELGIHISREELKEISGVGQTGRPHIAQAMINCGAVSKMDEAFHKYLKRGAAAHVSRTVHSSKEAIDLINQAGGVAVLAHPILIDPGLGSLPALLDELVPFGLSGIEVYYPTHSSKSRKQLSKYAKQYQLVPTGGSDYHGDIRKGTSLAGDSRCNVPFEILEGLKERITRKVHPSGGVESKKDQS